MPIKKVLSDTKFPVKIWTEDIEDSAMKQLQNIANMPFIFKHVAVMPDVHFGIGATVGSVVATKAHIIPAAVGVDIGCGMMAMKTNLNHEVVLEKAAEIRHSIERSIPLGHNCNKTVSERVEKWEGWGKDFTYDEKAKLQLGTLGGGNHFIEICLDLDKNVWIMLHSGSRNIGKRTADIHINKAKSIIQKMMINLPDPDLAYFAKDTPEFDAYLKDVTWCQQYAYENRCEMMARIVKDLTYACGEFLTTMHVNCHHNYIAHEHHFGENVYVTRKGAVRARLGDFGIIPGSMGTRSYIVEGLGNTNSFHSCSHGAGRRMSRGQARKTFTLEDFEKQTNGVECRKDTGVIDEIPGAYKAIEKVMEDQSDLVRVVAELKQIICVKG